MVATVPAAKPVPVQMHRLSTESYAKLESMLPRIYIDDKTTGLQTSFQLGVQHVLKLLREGWVTEQ